jgi:hypothetical protein
MLVLSEFIGKGDYVIGDLPDSSVRYTPQCLHVVLENCVNIADMLKYVKHCQTHGVAVGDDLRKTMIRRLDQVLKTGRLANVIDEFIQANIITREHINDHVFYGPVFVDESGRVVITRVGVYDFAKELPFYSPNQNDGLKKLTSMGAISDKTWRMKSELVPPAVIDEGEKNPNWLNIFVNFHIVPLLSQVPAVTRNDMLTRAKNYVSLSSVCRALYTRLSPHLHEMKMDFALYLKYDIQEKIYAGNLWHRIEEYKQNIPEYYSGKVLPGSALGYFCAKARWTTLLPKNPSGNGDVPLGVILKYIERYPESLKCRTSSVAGWTVSTFALMCIDPDVTIKTIDSYVSRKLVSQEDIEFKLNDNCNNVTDQLHIKGTERAKALIEIFVKNNWDINLNTQPVKRLKQ